MKCSGKGKIYALPIKVNVLYSFIESSLVLVHNLRIFVFRNFLEFYGIWEIEAHRWRDMHFYNYVENLSVDN
jgi:hypothetical protein